MAWLCGIMHPVRAARLDALGIDDGREDAEDRVFLGDGEIVHQRGVRRGEPLLLDELTGLVGDHEGDLARSQPARLITEKHHLAGFGIDLGMRRHRLRAQLAAPVVMALGLERDRIDLIRPPIFLGGEKLAGMPNRGRVRSRTVDALDRGIVRIRISVSAEQRLAALAVGLQPVGHAHIATYSRHGHSRTGNKRSSRRPRSRNHRPGAAEIADRASYDTSAVK